MMISFGFSLNTSRTIDIDADNFDKCHSIINHVPSYKRCIGCGGCAATCSAQQHSQFNILKCNLLFRRGEYDTLSNELDKCMLCGKCLLVCPRNVNTRAMIISMRNLLKTK